MAAIPGFGDDWAIVDGSHDARVGMVRGQAGTALVEQVEAESSFAADQVVYHREVHV